MFENGFVKLHRSMLSWEWFKDDKTAHFFIYCLLRCNWEDGNFQGVKVKKGQFISTVRHMADESGLTVQEVRTALKHLKLTHELTQEVTHLPSNRFSLISVVNWDLYQEGLTHDLTHVLTHDQHTANTPLTHDQHIYKNNKKKKEEKEVKKSDPYEIDTSDWDKLPTLSYEEAKKWEAENGRQWEGLIL